MSLLRTYFCSLFCMLSFCVVKIQTIPSITNTINDIEKYKQLKDIINILGVDELSDQDKTIVVMAKRMAKRIENWIAQPLFVAEQFVNRKGSFVTIEETLDGFE